jgi:hypothetical protein
MIRWMAGETNVLKIRRQSSTSKRTVLPDESAGPVVPPMLLCFSLRKALEEAIGPNLDLSALVVKRCMKVPEEAGMAQGDRRPFLSVPAPSIGQEGHTCAT